VPWWIWILIGLVLLGVEMVTPGFFLFFFGIAALVVGAMVAFNIGGPEWAQWLLFSAISLVSLFVFRGPLVAWMRSQELVSPVDTLQGEVATMLEDLSPGAVGKAELRGSAWTVQNGDRRTLTKGQRCRVSRVENLTLWVQAE
jgi:membrane protein implicated in regulation of membrane protease activity